VSSLSLSSFPYLLSVSVHKLVLILMICQIVAKHIDSIACVVLFDVGYVFLSLSVCLLGFGGVR
jgi:hypothetical protein